MPVLNFLMLTPPSSPCSNFQRKLVMRSFRKPFATQAACAPNCSLKKIIPALIVFAITLFGRELPAQNAQRDLFVSSRNTNSVKRYHGQTGAYLGDFVRPNAGGLNATQEVLFGLDGHLLVSGRGNRHILKFDRNTGNFLGNFTSGYELDNPTKMTVGPDSLLYISQWGQSKKKVARFKFSTGVFVDEFTETDLNQACGHAWDTGGNLYVASYGSADVRKFDASGKFLGVFTEAGRLRGAVNLWFGESGDLFVVDWILGSVLRFDGQTGRFKSNFITGMQNTEGFVFGPDSSLYLCDWSRNTINRYDRSGRLLGIFANSGGMHAPNSVTFGPSSATAVTNRESMPQDFALQQNYPNPFNPNTVIRFALPVRGQTRLTIYNIAGQLVRTLLDSVLSAGAHAVAWNSRDDRGRLVAAGEYLYRIEAGSFVEVKKMAFVR